MPACCTLRFSRRSATPQTGGDPSAVSRSISYTLYPKTGPPDVPYHQSIIWQLFMRYSYCNAPPSPRRAQLQPNRGPKSAPEPHFVRPASLITYRLWGVRVSPLSAGGEGLCKARSRLLKRQGKLAEGIQQQLGSFSCHCSTCSVHHHLYTLSRLVPWGSRFRLWKFKYRVVRFKKKRSRGLHAGIVSGSYRQLAGIIRGSDSAEDTWAQGRPHSCRAAPAGLGRPRRFQLLVLLFSCLPVHGMGAAQEPLGTGPSHPHASCVGKRAWIKAQRQACQQGQTWYRGRVVWSADVPRHPAIAQPTRRLRRNRPGATPRGATARLKIMTLNVGHMSASCGVNSRRTSGPAPVITMLCVCRSFIGLKPANSAWPAGPPWSLQAQTGQMESWFW